MKKWSQRVIVGDEVEMVKPDFQRTRNRVTVSRIVETDGSVLIFVQVKAPSGAMVEVTFSDCGVQCGWTDPIWAGYLSKVLKD